MNPTVRPPRKTWRARTLLLWTAVGGVAVFAVLTLISDFDDLWTALLDFPVLTLLAVAVLSLGNYSLRFLKWQWYLTRMGHRIPLGPSSVVFLSGFAMTVTPGKAGEFIKAFIMKVRHRTPYTVTTAALLMERFTDLVALVILSCLGLSLEFLHPLWAVGALTTIILFIWVIRNHGVMIFLIGKTAHVPLLGRVTDQIQEFYEKGSALMETGLLAGSIALSVVAWLCEGIGYYLVVQGLGFSITPIEGIFIYSASLLGGVLTLFAGGLVATEGALVGLGLAFGMNRSLSVAAAILIRLMTLWFAVILGWLAFVFSPTLRSLLRASSQTGGETSEML